MANKTREAQAQAQAQAKAQETALEIVRTESGLAKVLNTSLADYGYTSSKLDRDESTGEVFLTLKDSETKGDIVAPVKLTEKALADVDGFSALNDFDKLSGLYKCYYVWRIKAIADDNGFRSVGEFIEKNYGVKAGTANQYFRIADKCLDCTGDKPVWKYSWLNGATVSNLNQCMSIIDKCDSMEDFKQKYVDTGKLHVRAKQAQLKKEVAEITGKPDKKLDKAQDKAQDAQKPAGEESIESKWSAVEEYILSNVGESEAQEQALAYINTALKAIREAQAQAQAQEQTEK